MKFIKGGPGSGRHPGNGSRTPDATRIGPSRPYRSGVRPSELYPHGRNPDGTPRTSNDVRVPTGKPNPGGKPNR